MIGLDIFVDYGTFSAAGIPVIGAVPILPSDYTADAIYITAGNLVVQGSTANAITNPKYLGLKKVAIIANDSPATLSALATLEPALAFAGATAVVIKGGETETDAGYRLLMQQAAATNPEAIVSMYGQSGCVALMRARVELQVEVPAFTNTACLADTVINAVGDAAQGWYFAGSQRSRWNQECLTSSLTRCRRWLKTHSGPHLTLATFYGTFSYSSTPRDEP